MVVNLMSNGIKYNNEGGTLAVSVEAGADGYAFVFRDEGIGMSGEDQDRLFERFFRARAASDIPGTGLGLSIVKAIVERHGGSIDVKSREGTGTTFRVALPFRPPSA